MYSVQGSGVRTRRRLGLLANVGQPIVLTKDRNAQVTQMGRILHLLEQNPTAASLIDEVLNVRRDGLAEDVVAEHDHDLVAVDEALAQAKRFGNPAGAGLIGELETPQTELVAVAQQRQKFAR